MTTTTAAEAMTTTTSWQTRGKYSAQREDHGLSGYGTIPEDAVGAWHVDASQTKDEGFYGTLRFPMVNPKTTTDKPGATAYDYCTPLLWASLWAAIPGAVVTVPEGVQLLSPGQVSQRVTRSLYLAWRDYAGTITAEEAAELETARQAAAQERAKREAEKEARYSEPAQSGTVTWRGKEYQPPSMGDLEAWVNDSVCETPDGETVEPDHPDSWLSILGII